MESEIREMVYIAISALVLSIVLGFISIMGMVQGDIARTRNDEIAGNKNMMQYKEYNKYNQNELCGEEVVECIRLNYDQGITIYVASSAIPSAPAGLNEFNMTTYMVPANKQFFSVEEGGDLLSWFNNSKRYRAYLVYNSEKPQVKYERMMDDYMFTPEAVTGTLNEKYEALDSCEGIPVVNSEVTSILIIDSIDL